MQKINRYMLGHYYLSYNEHKFNILSYDDSFITAEQLNLLFMPTPNGFNYDIEYKLNNNELALNSISCDLRNKSSINSILPVNGVYSNLDIKINNVELIITDERLNKTGMFPNYFEYDEIYYLKVNNGEITFINLSNDLKELKNYNFNSYLNNPSVLEELFNDKLKTLQNYEVLSEIINFDDFYDYKME